VLGSRKADEAERVKLLSHVIVLRRRAQRLCDGEHENRDPAVQHLTELLDENCRLVTEPLADITDEDMEAAHRYADQLEELLPHVAHDAYLWAVLTYELAGGAGEPIKLSSVVDDAALVELRGAQRAESSLSKQLAGDRVAESLSLLYKVRADHMRHERLMAKLRAAHLPYLVLSILTVLVLLAVAIWSGGKTLDASPRAGWAQLLLVAAAGALGSLLAATFRLRDTVQLSPLRSILALTVIQPLIGASFGLMSWLILTSGFVTIGGTDNQTWPTQAVVAFAAGFSEPLFLNIIGKALAPQT
jgi:hypothetical protein